MPDDLLSVLTRFHREVVVPDITRIVDERFGSHLSPFRDEVLTNFDAVFKRLDRLEDEYQALAAAVGRLEARMTAVEEKIEKLALRSELDDLRSRVEELQQKIAALESHI